MVSFRLSPEEDDMLEMKVRLSGLTKQEYIIRRLTENKVTIRGNIRIYKMLRHQLEEITWELHRIKSVSELDDDFLEMMKYVMMIADGMKNAEEEKAR